jgi:hypothetical protein
LKITATSFAQIYGRFSVCAIHPFTEALEKVVSLQHNSESEGNASLGVSPKQTQTAN